MLQQSRLARSLVVTLVAAAVAVGSGYLGVRVGRHYEFNKQCCVMPRVRNYLVSFEQALHLKTFYSQIGQDLWVAETVFPGVTNGFFLDVGSGDGTEGSNTKMLEDKGWTGVCVDPFPVNMADRTCQVFKEVVYREAGKAVTFNVAGEFGGITDDLGRWQDVAKQSRTVQFTTVTLADILERAKAPRFISFISLDIEGAELDALRGFPFETYTFGAMVVEHNYEEAKRAGIDALLTREGYRRVHTWQQDDYYVRAAALPHTGDREGG